MTRRLTRRPGRLTPAALPALAIGLLLSAVPAAAAPGPFAGTWRIVESSDLAGTPATAPLLGAELAFEADRVDGPHPLGCGGAAYHLAFVPPLGLFQGGLAPEEAETVAERLQLLPEAPTLRVDCDSGSFDYHAQPTGPPRLVIMLDEQLLTLELTGD